jgi:TonB dependent receptor/TonB-dependent Receptor Plug Domain
MRRPTGASRGPGAALLACLFLPGLALAAGPETEAELPPIVVSAPPRPDEAASALDIGAAELATRPLQRNGDLLEAAPGLVATQHSGEGKANQYFLRGFNLDHGTDLAIHVDGMPVNMRTHAHGQGYADIGFVIPELVGNMNVRKGPYFADDHDFANAGALRLAILDAFAAPYVAGTGGMFGYGRGVAIGSRALGNGTLLAAGEAVTYQGPWVVGDNLRKFNGVLRYSQGSMAEGFSLMAMGYSGIWHATDQIPARALTEGAVTRFGAIDPTDAGRSQRASLSANYVTTGDWGVTRVNAWAIRYTLDLWNNFTYFLNDPVNGDQFHQADRRWILGGEAIHSLPWTAFGQPAETRFGLQSRYDDIRLGLFNTVARQGLSTVLQDQVGEGSLGAFTDTTLRPTEKARLTLGLREDWLGGRVQSAVTPANSGYANGWITSPKAGLVLGPWSATEFFLNAGTGFHSNDLRGATIRAVPTDPLTPLSRVPLIVRSKGAEIGALTRAVEGLESRLALFVLDLGSELVFQGDTGTTEPTRASRRIGVEWVNRWALKPGLALDLDLAATRARYIQSDPAGNFIPGAPNVVLAGGVVWDRGTGWYAVSRLRLFGPRPLTESGNPASQATTTVNARLGYRFENGVRAQFDVFNLFNSRAHQIDYYYTSRLPWEPAAGVADRVFHPLEPLAVRFTLAATL